MKQKRVMLAILAVAVVIIVIAVVAAVSSSDEEKYVDVLENGTKVNTSEKLAETKTYNGLEITNIKFTNSNSVTSLSADVTNTTTESTERQEVDINVLDEDGNVITSFLGIIEALDVGETTTLSAGTLANYSNAYDIEIVDAE